ncbi:MAG: DNA-binding domain-containing protein [Gammaproteobacteria bacterium]
MPALRELQLAFVASMFDESDAVRAHVREEGMSAEARLGIYRNNLREGFIKALALGFPVIERLGGTDYFRQRALEYLAAHPSRSGNLHYIGAQFAPFLARKFAGTQYAYFADVAALEWAYQEAQVAADADALSPEAFANVAAEDYERLTFEFHPACHFVQSRYPIVKIWRANQPETLSDEVIDLDAGGDNVLVLRTPECVELHRLPAARFALFDALNRGEDLGTALERGEALESGFDFGAALRHLVELRILTTLRVPALST